MPPLPPLPLCCGGKRQTEVNHGIMSIYVCIEIVISIIEYVVYCPRNQIDIQRTLPLPPFPFPPFPLPLPLPPFPVGSKLGSELGSELMLGEVLGKLDTLGSELMLGEALGAVMQ